MDDPSIDEIIEKAGKLHSGDEAKDLIVQCLAAVMKALAAHDAKIKRVERQVSELEQRRATAGQ